MNSSNNPGVLHARFDWLDQARGLIVLLLVISMPTDKYAGDVLTGDPVLGPAMLNHGYEYFDGTPPIITFIDVGQALFMFIMGFVGYFAFTSRLQKRGSRIAFWYAARRVAALYALAFFDSVFVRGLLLGKPEWADFFYKGTFTMLALGALAGFGAIVLVRDPDRRIFLSVGLALLHSVVYAYPIFDHAGFRDNALQLWQFPFGALAMSAIAIAGTCFGQWYLLDVENPFAGFRSRILPISAGMLLAAYCMDWVQPAEHHDVTASLQFQAIAFGGFTLMIFYAFGAVGFRFPLLSSLGKNLLLLFAVGGLLVSIYVNLIPKSFLVESPYLTVLLAGVAPVVGISCVALFLEKRGIMVRA